jgi:PAS domain S-box-containing protein
MAETDRPEGAAMASDLFRFLVENVQDYAILMLDTEGRVATWNPGAERILGYPEQEILGQHFSRFFTPEDVRRGLPERELKMAAAEGRALDENWAVRKNGSRFWASGVTHPLTDGTLHGYVKVFRDLTDKKRAEDRLRDQTQISETLNRIGRLLAVELDVTKLLQKVTDEATTLTRALFGAFFYNRIGPQNEMFSLYTLSGLPREMFSKFPLPRNTPLFDPVFRGDDTIRLDDVEQDPRFGQNPPFNGIPEGLPAVRSFLGVPVVSRSNEVLGGMFFGHTRPGVFTARDERLVVGIAGQAAIAIDNARLFEDARRLSDTLRRQNDELADTDRRKNEFLAMLGHELRNPLAPIANALHIIQQEKQVTPIIEQATGMAYRQVLHLTRLVDDLLDVARITRGTIQLHKSRVELAQVISRAVETAQPMIAAGRHELSVSYPRDTIWLDADGARMQQVIVNLLSNSSKFTPPGGRIWLTAHWEGQNVVIRVKDTGLGIAPDLLPKVFDLFTQAERSLARSEGGLGIGLTMVRKVVDLHGGAVEAYSPGLRQGSEFVVRLPILEVERFVSSRPTHEPAPLKPPKAGRPLRLLVVDDNVDAAQSLAMLLRAVGHEVVGIVHSGPEAVEAIGNTVPDAVLLDIGLPGLDGYEVARRVRKDRRCAKVRLIAVTGYGLETDKQRSAEAGFDHHIVKPIDPTRLLALLASTAS